MAERFHYGGQAVVEGVMIRGQKSVVTAVRRPSGELAIETQPLAIIYTGWMRKTPLIRGVVVLIESVVLGIRALLYSANASLADEGEKVSGGLLWTVLIFALAVAVGLFFVGPLYLTRLISPHINSSVIFNLIEGCIRVIIFIAYLKLVALLPDLRRTFAYHGAEHKAVNGYEDGAKLEVEAIRKYHTAHVRCGTSFLFVVLVVAILVFALVGLHSTRWIVLSRVVLVPVIAAISYEIIYFSARHRHAVVKAVLAPGLWLQSLTTREPDDSQMEVALAALKKAVEIDQPQATA